MLRLRDLHERAKREPEFEEPEPGAAMAALAREFPGALRETDQLPITMLADRVAALDAALLDPACITPWMRASWSFHRLARGALAVKRWLATSTTSPAARGDLEAAIATSSLAFPDDARAWLDDLAAIAEPPRGRLMDLVYGRVAAELGLSFGEARCLVLTK